MTRRDAAGGPRRRVLLLGLLLTALLLLGRGFQLQVLEAGTWAARAQDQHSQLDTLPAPRGTIYDRNGVPLAASRESFRIAVAPREVTERAQTARLLERALALTPAETRRALNRRKRWVLLPGRFDASVRGKLAGVRGVYFERVMQRFYPHGTLASELIGTVSAEGRAVAGLELQLDSLLLGRAGITVARRDARGRAIPGAMMDVVEPAPGHDVFLTLDYDLQEMAQQALLDAVRTSRATGGELLLMDPRSGEVLAAVSARGQSVHQWLAATEPYEPGSTLKPFFVAALLAQGDVSLADSVYAEKGTYVRDGRTIKDVHGYEWLTVEEALRHSSNVAMVKLSEQLDAAAQYRYLRNFGFGTSTGVPYPGESAGKLRRPAAWSRYSQGSLAIGYEISVTPLQMALAYGAIANGGILMEPRLVREVRSRDGRRVAQFRPRAVRRVIPPQLARQLRGALLGAVEDGTGSAAALGPYEVAGKTGTARMFTAGRYEAGAYAASFAGFFPVENPQLVFLAKLDRPQGGYYGGVAAAPITRAMLEAALAGQNTALNRAVVATLPAAQRAATVPAFRTIARAEPSGAGPFVFALKAGAPQSVEAESPEAVRPVPDVAGLPLRDAAVRLHASGFLVRVTGAGAVVGSLPLAGEMAAGGSVVEVIAGGRP